VTAEKAAKATMIASSTIDISGKSDNTIQPLT
jgi:hypothetical protein